MKYAALTLSTVATALLALTLVGVVNQIGSGSRPLPPVQNALAPLSAQQMSDQAAVELALQSLDKLPSTRFFVLPAASGTGANAGTSAESLSAFDGNIFALLPKRADIPAPSNNRRLVVAKAPPLPLPLPLPQVTVVVESGASGKAVINGQLSRVGDAVGEGMVVSSINVDSVTFSSGKEMLEVRMPLDRLRVLGAFPGSSKGN
jgi:hypothetical protein